MRAIGYVRVSKGEQRDEGFGLDAQRHAIREAVRGRGWKLVKIEQDAASGRSVRKRPGLDKALALVEDGCDVLVVAKLDRLSRSVVDFGQLLQRARANGWAVVALDLGVDTTTSTGKLVAGIMMQVAEWERDRISERTTEGLAEARRQGSAIGRPRVTSNQLRKRVRRMHGRGVSYAAIARTLDEEGVLTAQGGARWYPSTVRALVRGRQDASGRPTQRTGS